MEQGTEINSNRLFVPNRCKDPYYFEDILVQQERIFEDIKELDLSKITFIEPYSMLSLLLLGKNYLRNRGEKLRLINIPTNIHQYLARMDFLKTEIFEVPYKLNEKMQLKRSSFSSRVIEVTEIPNKERESVKVISEVIALFRKRASHILKYWLSESIIDYFVTVISEVCQNVFEHSLDSGYFSIQTYTMGKENIVRLVISDSGIGIKKSFDNKLEIEYESTAKLIENVFTTPLSSKRKFGYGLCQVNSIIERFMGTVFIRSGDASVTALYRQGKGRTYNFLKNDLTYFNGTQISISLMGQK
ncbi:MAG: ATP-binding protein [bacterium]|nr:ATP-binding protein [bacterium]